MSEQWTYVIAAYVVTLGGLAVIAAHSYSAMRAAERRIDGKKDR